MNRSENKVATSTEWVIVITITLFSLFVIALKEAKKAFACHSVVQADLRSEEPN